MCRRGPAQTHAQRARGALFLNLQPPPSDDTARCLNRWAAGARPTLTPAPAPAAATVAETPVFLARIIGLSARFRSCKRGRHRLVSANGGPFSPFVEANTSGLLSFERRCPSLVLGPITVSVMLFSVQLSAKVRFPSFFGASECVFRPRYCLGERRRLFRGGRRFAIQTCCPPWRCSFE